MRDYMVEGYIDGQWKEVRFNGAIELLLYLEHHSISGMTLKCAGTVIDMDDLAKDARREVDEAG